MCMVMEDAVEGRSKALSVNEKESRLRMEDEFDGGRPEEELADRIRAVEDGEGKLSRKAEDIARPCRLFWRGSEERERLTLVPGPWRTRANA